MKKIPLTQGQWALVADKHYTHLMRRHSWEKSNKPVKWHAWWNSYTHSFYAVRNIYLPNGKRTSEKMHRRILRLKHGDPRQGDHINHQTLDNQPKNLRIVTARGNYENIRNQSKHGVGISFKSTYKSKPFQARAQINGKYLHIGYYATIKEAQMARKIWLQAHGVK